MLKTAARFCVTLVVFLCGLGVGVVVRLIAITSINQVRCRAALCCKHFRGTRGWGAKDEFLMDCDGVVFENQYATFKAFSNPNNSRDIFIETVGFITGQACATQVVNLCLPCLDELSKRASDLFLDEKASARPRIMQLTTISEINAPSAR